LSEQSVHQSDLNEAFTRVWGSADLVEGRQARADKRAPVFRGE
jgi:hypothetical protein